MPPLLFATFCIEGIVTIWALFQWKQSEFQQRFLIVFLTMISMVEITESWMALYNIHNLWLINVSSFGECLALLGLFYSWKTKIKDKRLIAVIAILFVIIWCLSKFTFEPFDQIGSFTSGIAKLIEIAFAIWILFDVLKDPKASPKIEPRIWAASAVIIYAAGSLLLFALFYTMLRESHQLFKTVWPINWLLMDISFLLYARAIWCPGTKSDL
jgi:hypothetical protein